MLVLKVLVALIISYNVTAQAIALFCNAVVDFLLKIIDRKNIY